MGTFNKLTQFKYNGESNMTVITALLLFYLIIANNNLKTLYSGQLTQYIQQNRLLQHIIAYTMMLVIVILFGKITNITTAAVYALIAYLWFVLTTKMDIEFNLLILALLVIGFLYENNIKYKEESANTDEALTKKERKQIKKDYSKQKKIVIISILVLTIIGSAVYVNKKYNQYGSAFDPVDFIIKEGKKYKLVT